MRIKILRTSLALFLNNGIRNISMDHIANEAGISKRTLYEYFPSKLALLEECITISFMKRSYFPSDSIVESKINSLDVIIRIYHYYLLTLLETNPSCIKDLQKYYPDLFHQTFLFHERLIDLMLEKVSQDQFNGLIKDNIERQMVSFFYKDILYLLFVSDGPFNQIERSTHLPEILIHFTKGICTPKGLEYFETSLQKQ